MGRALAVRHRVGDRRMGAQRFAALLPAPRRALPRQGGHRPVRLPPHVHDRTRMVDVADVAYAPTPSLVTAAPLGARTFGMSLGGGYTAILPLFTFETGYGLSRRIDLTFR